MRLHRVGEVLAIDPDIYEEWSRRLGEANTTTVQAEAQTPEAAARLVPGRKSVGDVAVISLSGFITQKPTLFSLLFGGTSAEGLAREVSAAVNDASVGAVVLSVDSPGGSVFGLPEAAAAIRNLRGPKPIVAVANPIMASAAYHLASQADEVIATPSAVVGSIGTIAVHVDESKALEEDGLVVTQVSYGRRKAERSSLKPLSEEGRTSLQAEVDYYGRLFEADVAKGRKVALDSVRAKYGEGSVMTAAAGLEAGLIDRIATLDDVVAELGRGRKPTGTPRAYDGASIRAIAALTGIKLSS